MTADGSTVVYAQGSEYLTDPEATRSLYSVPITGGEPIALTPDVVDGEVIWYPEISPDGTRVVFWWIGATEGGLYSVFPRGENLTKISGHYNPSLQPLGMVSPDSSYVLYYDGGWTSLEAYVVQIGGGEAPIKLAGPPAAGGRIEDGWITPDSSHYVYRADHDTAGITELFAVPLAGGVSWKLNHPLDAGQSVGELLEIIPDSSGVLYSVIGMVSPPTWYRVPITGGTAVEISQAIGPVHISPDSSTVVLDNAVTTAYPLDGGPRVQLANRGSVVISPDSSVVWVWQNDDFDGVAQLYTVPPGGGALEAHAGTNAPTSNHDGYLTPDSRMHVTPDSSRFVYAADTNGNGELELMMVSAHGGDAVELAADVFTWATHESEFSGLFISPDSARVVYSGDPFGTGAGVHSSLLTRYPESSDAAWFLVTINVGNVNDNPPVADDLAATVAEDAPLGYVVGTVGGDDADGDPLAYSLIEPDSLFEIDGDAVVTLIGRLDYDIATEHQFTVEVSDGVFTDTATVTVNVTDVDSPPTTTTTTTTAPPPPPPEFGDVPDTSLFHSDIVWLASAGITKGCNPPVNDQFCPNGYVTRGQMAAFLDRALNLAEPQESDLFVDDDGSMFESQIDRLAAAGITKGCNPPDNTLFCPGGNVTRAQMAAFLHRALNNE